MYIKIGLTTKKKPNVWQKSVWVFWGTYRNQFEFSTSLTYRIRQNDKMTLKKPQKLLCEIKKKEKQQFGGKFGIRLSQPPEKKIWSNSCTIPQIIAIIEYQIFMKKKKSFFFSQQPHDCSPKTLLIESGVTITVFFLHPIPLFCF